MISFVVGDLIAERNHWPMIAHGVNCQKRMGAGFAQKLSNVSPGLLRAYAETDLTPGQCWLWKPPSGPVIANLATQEYFGNRGRARLNWVTQSLQQLKLAADANNIHEIAMPAIAAGLGGLLWADVRIALQTIFTSWTGNVTVYEQFAPATSTTIERRPWRMTPQDMIPYNLTIPRHQHTIQPDNYSEEALHAATLQMRQLNTEPPSFPDYPIWTWRALLLPDNTTSIEQLRQVTISAIIPTETSWPLPPVTVERYARWTAATHRYPPLSLNERPNGRLELREGHHRLAALKSLNYIHALAWVSPAYLNHAGHEYTLHWEDAVREAIAFGEPVPEHIRNMQLANR